MAEIQPIGPFNINSLSTPLPARMPVQGEPPPTAIAEGMQIRKRVSRDFGIEILDSDVKFSGAECAVIEDTLKEIKKKRQQHLIGVRQIIKNREYRVRLQTSALIHAGGAYDADSKRIFIFDSIAPEEIPEVIVHEVGHAVSYFNMEFSQFMDFVKQSGYNMVEFRKYFIPGNQYHQIGMKRVDIEKTDWEKVLDRFSMKSLSHSEDVFGEIILEAQRRKRFPWDENPLEKFAWAYEWYFNRGDEFVKMAEHAAERGDRTWLADYQFLKNNVFNEGPKTPPQ